MSDFVYPTVEQVVRLNEQYGGPMAGTRSLAGVDAQLARASSGFGDEELFPSIWDKAAVILHGIASTQYFFDGNKRTAWLASVLFLAANGVHLREMQTVQYEALVLAASKDLLDISKTAEWLEASAMTSADRCRYAVVAKSARMHADAGAFDLEGGGVVLMALHPIPVQVIVGFVAQIDWHISDEGKNQRISLSIEAPTGLAQAACFPKEVEERWKTEPSYAPPESLMTDRMTHDIVPFRAPSIHHPSGMNPAMIVDNIRILVGEPCTVWFRLERNGELMARVPLEITRSIRPD